ncbi:MAG: FkbM family methyltransferase, partial [Bdellovibrionota bacterium]
MKLINRFSSPVYKVKYKGQVLRAVYSNFNEAFRIARWLVKEPGTITWIESFPENSVFFDVGANVGLFSIFAAKIRGAQVYSFEPFWGNFFHLKENIELNGVTHKVTPFNLGLSDHNSFLSLRLEDTESGSSGGQ